MSFQTSLRTNHKSLVEVGFLTCVSETPDTLCDAEIRALWGAIHHFQYFLFFYTMKIVHNDFGYMFGVVALW